MMRDLEAFFRILDTILASYLGVCILTVGQVEQSIDSTTLVCFLASRIIYLKTHRERLGKTYTVTLELRYIALLPSCTYCTLVAGYSDTDVGVGNIWARTL